MSGTMVLIICGTLFVIFLYLFFRNLIRGFESTEEPAFNPSDVDRDQLWKQYFAEEQSDSELCQEGTASVSKRCKAHAILERRRESQPKYDRWRRKRRNETVQLDLGELARRLTYPVAELKAVWPSYSTRYIPKRTGGMRILHVPDKKTAELQRCIHHRLLQRLWAHETATGFEQRQSVVDNALPHAARAVVVRMDIIDFFPSTSAERVEVFFKRIGWDEECAGLLTKWTTHYGGLPQGAPTSPRLSNLVNGTMDAYFHRIAKQYRGTYTRYADDITFSFDHDDPKKIRGLIQVVRRILRAYGYKMHTRKKLNIRRRHQRQEVTGLVVNDGVRLPRKTRRWLRAVKHHKETGQPMSITDEQLQGWLAYEQMIEKQGGWKV